jgi:ubiquinone/menaquinone biosynthesis C-methylase UbiE
MKRVAIPEWLDTDSGTPAEIADSLSDLRRINRWFGGNATTQSLIRHVARKIDAQVLSLLEVAAGAGAVAQEARTDLQREGIRLDVTLLDRVASHVGNCSASQTWAVAGDALALPFKDGSFDLVSCCLFAHHLAPQELVQFVNEGLRVSRRAVLINDLVRHRFHLALVYAGWPLYRSRLTRHDAPASVRQSYTPEEMHDLLQQTAATDIEMHRHFLFRMGVVVWK